PLTPGSNWPADSVNTNEARPLLRGDPSIFILWSKPRLFGTGLFEPSKARPSAAQTTTSHNHEPHPPPTTQINPAGCEASATLRYDGKSAIRSDCDWEWSRRLLSCYSRRPVRA